MYCLYACEPLLQCIITSHPPTPAACPFPHPPSIPPPLLPQPAASILTSPCASRQPRPPPRLPPPWTPACSPSSSASLSAATPTGSLSRRWGWPLSRGALTSWSGPSPPATVGALGVVNPGAVGGWVGGSMGGWVGGWCGLRELVNLAEKTCSVRETFLGGWLQDYSALHACHSARARLPCFPPADPVRTLKYALEVSQKLVVSREFRSQVRSLRGCSSIHPAAHHAGKLARWQHPQGAGWALLPACSSAQTALACLPAHCLPHTSPACPAPPVLPCTAGAAPGGAPVRGGAPARLCRHLPVPYAAGRLAGGGHNPLPPPLVGAQAAGWAGGWVQAVGHSCRCRRPTTPPALPLLTSAVCRPASLSLRLPLCLVAGVARMRRCWRIRLLSTSWTPSCRLSC